MPALISKSSPLAAYALVSSSPGIAVTPYPIVSTLGGNRTGALSTASTPVVVPNQYTAQSSIPFSGGSPQSSAVVSNGVVQVSTKDSGKMVLWIGVAIAAYMLLRSS